MSFQHIVDEQTVRKEEYREEHDGVAFIAYVSDNGIAFETKPATGFGIINFHLRLHPTQLVAYAQFMGRVAQAVAE